MELVGYKNISTKEEQQISELLNDLSIIALNNRIKEKYIDIRKTHGLKLADAIIAATAIVFGFPLITADKQFKVVKGLNLITYQHDIKTV